MSQENAGRYTAPSRHVANVSGVQYLQPVAPVTPPVHKRQPSKGWLIAIIVAVALCIVAGASGAVMYSGNIGPLKDSGIAACQGIAKDVTKPDKSASDTKMTTADYQKARKAFADSRYDDIRKAGTTFVDFIWQIENMGSDAGFAALGLIGTMYSDYGALSGACAAHGVVIPPLPSN